MLHTSMHLKSWLRGSGRKWPLRAQQRKAVPRPCFKCNDRDAAPDLWSEHELGGSCSAKEASFWRRKIET